MTEEQLARHLCDIVKAGPIYKDHKTGVLGGSWDEDFEHLTIAREAHFVELQYTDSGVGEDYVVFALQHKWPDRSFSLDTEGGCDTCQYGRTVSITISGTTPPWEVQS